MEIVKTSTLIKKKQEEALKSGALDVEAVNKQRSQEFAALINQKLIQDFKQKKEKYQNPTKTSGFFENQANSTENPIDKVYYEMKYGEIPEVS